MAGKRTFNGLYTQRCYLPKNYQGGMEGLMGEWVTIFLVLNDWSADD